MRLYERARRLTWLLLVGGLAFGGLLGYVIGMSIRRPTAELREAVNQLAAGRLNRCPTALCRATLRARRCDRGRR